MRSERYIVAVDQSTSATKAFVVDVRGRIIGKHVCEHSQYYPRPGFVEHDANEIFDNVVLSAQSAVGDSGIDEPDIAALAITNQRETAVVWNRHTGEPVSHAAVWQCLRGDEICKDLKAKGYENTVREKTGLILDPYFSGSKIKWILNNTPGAQAKADAGDLLFGTIDSWLVWKLTHGATHVTDTSNACRTMLFNIHTLDWDEELLELFGIPSSMAPAVVHADTIVGTTARDVPFSRSVPIAGLLGDSHAALFARHCFTKGSAKASYGTGSSIMMNVGHEPLSSTNGLVCSVGFSIAGDTHFVLEGNIHCTGCTIKWMVDDLRLISSAEESESVAREVSSTDGVYLVPGFAGLGAPYWDSDARAAIIGMSRGSGRAHVVRAGLESIGYQVRDLIDVMVQEAGVGIGVLKTDGGPSENALLMQFQADILNTPVSCAEVADVSALGSSYAAGLAAGMWSDLDQIAALSHEGAEYAPEMSDGERDRLYAGWKQAVGMVRTG